MCVMSGRIAGFNTEVAGDRGGVSGEPDLSQVGIEFAGLRASGS